MKILMLAPFMPRPDARAGAPQVIYDRLVLLAPHHRVTLITFAEPGEEAEVESLRRLGIKVSYATRGTARSGTELWRKRLRIARALLFSKSPLLVAEFRSSKIVQMMRSTLKTDKPDLLLIEHLLMAQYVPAERDRHHLPVLLSDHDVLAGRSKGTPPADRLARRLGGIEQRRWQRYAAKRWKQANAVLVPSEADAAVVRRLAPSATVEVVPFGVAPRQVCLEDNEPRDDSTLLFVGNFDHPPNRDAAVRLAKSIFPVVKRSCPAARLLLVGKSPTPDVRALDDGDSGVVVLGDVPSAAEYLCRCALFIAPLESGGGTRIKLLEAMMAGTPIVTTHLGARGLDVQDGRHLLIAAGDSAFAETIVAALRDRQLRERIGAEALALACGPEQRARRAARLEDIVLRYSLK